MALNIKIDNFEGPFDLLLTLIKQNEMSIYDVKINEITTQYLEYIDDMKDMDIDVASEFIVIAATLIEIKSRHLLPKVEDDNAVADEDINPEEELMKKLLEYNKIKDAAFILKEKEQGNMYSKKPELIKEEDYKYNDILKGIDINRINSIYSILFNTYKSKINKKNKIQRRIYADVYKTKDKIKEFKDILDKKPSIFFTDIRYNCESKAEVVVTFLALLELIRLRYVGVVQRFNFEDIFIERINVDETNGN